MHTIIDPHELNSAAHFKSASYFIFMYDVCDLRSFKGLSSLSLRSRSPYPSPTPSPAHLRTTHSYGQRLTLTPTPSCMMHSLVFFDAQSLDSLALIVVLISSPRFAVFCCVRMSKFAESCGAPWTIGASADIHGMG